MGLTLTSVSAIQSSMQHRYEVRIFRRYIAYYDIGRSLVNS